MQSGVGFNLLGTAFNQGSTLVVNVIVANLVGTEAFGRYTMVLATVSTVAALGQLSMGFTATKHVAEFRSVDLSRTSRILGLCATVSFVSALIAGLALASTAPWLAGAVLKAPDLAPMLQLAAAAVFFTVLNGFWTGALAGLEEYSALAKAGVVSGTLYAVLCIASAKVFGLTGAVAGVALSAFVQCVLLGWVLARAATRHGMAITVRGIWQERTILSMFAVPASLTGMVSLPALWISNAVLANQMDGYRQLALFGAANSFRTMVLYVPQAINNVGMSLLNNQRRSSAEGYRRVFWMNAAWTAASALAAAGLLFLASSPLLSLFGPAFAAGRGALGILLAAAIVEAVGIAAYQIVVSRGTIWASLWFVSLPRDLSLVALAVLLTPTLGAVGLATAYASGWVLALAGILALVWRLGLSAAAPAPVSAR
jgi:O-antigen/teichoic acid export membrane protein